VRRVAVCLAAGVLGLASMASPALASGPDPGAWVYNATNHHFYAQVDNVTWADAEALGVKLGGHLVTVDDQAEQDWLMATFPQDWLWIGLNDQAREGRWVWSSGTRVRYVNWSEGEPDNWKGFDPLGEHAATLTSPGVPQWSDISGRWLGSGIVEAGRSIPTARTATSRSGSWRRARTSQWSR
jgi:Lectin C-type domain